MLPIRSIFLISTLLFLTLTITHSRAGETGGNPAGTWRWVAPANPDGQVPAITFSLKFQGESLTGTVNRSSAAAAITNGIIKGDQISFQTVRAGKAGVSRTIYKGKLAGDAIKGTVENEVGGKKLGPQEWEARRVKN